ncbi:hypothetical protein CF54_31865 [Streptomyces sp. Tu 6176]|uniref:DUF6302 family protein n=1 Tax=Streptomyces sp. Tu 6176 TaxID=1470557 RepID=UPI0004450574|nr:DUF6302 family protein [Streptomyces sp. Tu 6176]EYT79347.1 hypothetical protein CF54_31865 [Streptomyces sp. Tu 6176]
MVAIRLRPVRLTVEVRRPCRRDEWELSWYRERLADLTILDAAVTIVVDRTRFLAVPVPVPVPETGGRRGGYLIMTRRRTAQCLRDVLDGMAGFPDVRVVLPSTRAECHAVRWGDEPPGCWDDYGQGHFYGYRDQAIGQFVADLL